MRGTREQVPLTRPANFEAAYDDIPVYRNKGKLQKYNSGIDSGVNGAEFVQFGDLSVNTCW